jgi:hypothetical protein
MLRLITNLFKTPKDINKSTVSIEVDLQPTKEQLFDDAVQAVIKRKLKEHLYDEFTKLCYSPEQMEQTEAARKYKQEGWTMDVVRQKYPKAIYEWQSCIQGYHIPYLGFDIWILIERLIEQSFQVTTTEENKNQ